MPDLGAFAKITPRSAYWLGFLTADGCVSRREVILVLHRRDAEHVRAFASFIGCDDRPLATVNGGNGVRLAVGSAALARQLEEYGVVAGRGNDPDLRVPEVLASSRDFWRGVVDGDGSVKLTPPAPPQVQLVGRPMLIEQFADHLAPVLDARPRPHAHSQSSAVLMLGVGGRSAKAVAQHLYGAAPADVLRRKRDRAAAIRAWEPKVRSRYPWETWADGGEWELRRGADFDVPRRLWEAGRREARRRGAELRFEERGDTVILQLLRRT